MSSKMDERIIVSPRSDVFPGEAYTFQGFVPLEDERVEPVLRGLCASPRLARRGDVEDDPSLKQPIPYIVLSRSSASGQHEVFAYTRLTGGGEARLHGKRSIGVGGHMNRDFTYDRLDEVVGDEAGRELAEELRFTARSGEELAPPTARLIGLINDDSGPVQQVHLGLLAVAEIPDHIDVTVRETDRLEGHWEPIAALLEAGAQQRLEEWSRHALRAFIGE